MIKNENKSVKKNVSYAYGFKLILDYFNQDKDKAISWYLTPNPGLGNISPYEMIKIGRGRKLIKFIESALAENY